MSTNPVGSRVLDLSRIPVLDREAGWTLEGLVADSETVPRHFPADRYGPPSLCVAAGEFKRHAAGVVGYVEGDTTALCPEAAFNVLRSYRILLSTLGMTVDHHGWVFLHRAHGRFPELTVARLEPLMPRVLRCLWLLELRGYSKSGYRDRTGYSYAHSLAEKLVSVLGITGNEGVLARECIDILEAS